MSGDFQSLSWCCRDVRVQLNNTLNLVTYLQVQLLEVMDENQQLKAQLGMCSEVKSPVKLKEAPHHFTPHSMRELTNANVKMASHDPIQNADSSGVSAPTSVPPLSHMPPQVPHLGAAPQPLANGPQAVLSPQSGERPEASVKAGDVRSAPLRPKLAQQKVVGVKKDLKVPKPPSMEGAFKCDKCPMSFPTAEFLSFHLPTHSGKKKGYHICPVCDAMFVVKGDLSKHLALHPDIKQYVCPVCNKSYTSKTNYKLHVKVHTGEGLYPCSYCGKSFHTENHLNVHLRTHTGERPYECSYCQKSFTQKSGLVNHTRLHTGEKPFMCPLCPKAFTQKSNLNFHLSKHHPPQNAFHSNDSVLPSQDHQFPENDSSNFAPVDGDSRFSNVSNFAPANNHSKFSNVSNFAPADSEFTPREN